MRARAIDDPVIIRAADAPPVIATLYGKGAASGIVLVHGILGRRALPEVVTIARALAAEHDVLAIDVLGHGDDTGRFTWGRDEWRQVDAAARFLARGGRRVAAVGFSFGGYHTARAAAHGAPLERIVLVGAPVDLRVVDHLPRLSDLARHLPPALRRRRALPRVGRLPRLGATAIPPAELAAIGAAALIVHCGADWLIARRHAERFAAEIGNARLVTIPRALHAEYAVESPPGVLVDLVGRFLADS